MDADTKADPVEQGRRPAADGARAAYRKVTESAVAKQLGSYWPKSRRMRLTAVAILAAVLVGLTLWWWLGTGAKTESLIVTVERGDVEDNVTALGNLQPRDYVDVGAQVSGQLDKLHVDFGSKVKKGDLLAEIDAQLQSTKVVADQAQLKNLRAQQAERQALLDLARGQYSRQKILKAAKATSEDAYQSSLSAMQSAVANLNSIKAQIEQTSSTLKGDQVTLGYTKIYAPMAGTVVSITTKQGQTINANQQAPIILRVADLTTMTVWTQVSEADVPKLKVGMEAYFTILGSPEKRWRGKLKQILPTPETVNNVVLYTALFDVDNKSGDLMTQMTAQVFFVIAGKQDVVNVPVAALHRYKPGRKKFKATVVTASGGREQRDVTIGVANRVSAEVISGLKEGEKVVAGTKSTTSGSGSGSGSQRNGQGGGRGGGGGGFRGFP